MTDFDFGKTFSFLFLSLGPFKVIGPFAAVQRWRALIFGAAAVALASACALKVPQQSASLTAIEATDVTAGELQMRIYEAGRRFSSIIEATADTIAARSPDPTIRHNALNWKIAAIPLIEEASLRPDPVVAAVDLWGFSMQLADYVERGDGRDAFGDLQPLAIAATDTLERLMRDISTRVSGAGKTAPSGQSLRTWAEQHPLRGSDLRRESILSSDLKALSMTETSLTGTIAGLQRNLIGVNNRLGYVNEGVFKRVLWQSQLATADLVPQLLQSGRTALMHDLSDQQRQLMGELDKQRLAKRSRWSGRARDRARPRQWGTWGRARGHPRGAGSRARRASGRGGWPSSTASEPSASGRSRRWTASPSTPSITPARWSAGYCCGLSWPSSSWRRSWGWAPCGSPGHGGPPAPGRLAHP